MNVINLIGNLTKEPELKYTQSSKAVVDMTIAVNGYNERVDYFKVQAWNKMAENCDKFLSKGSKIGVTGRLQNNNYEDNNGVKHYGQVVVAEKVEFLNKKQTTEAQSEEEFDEKFPQVSSDEIPYDTEI